MPATIQELLQDTVGRLKNSESPRLDAELLLAEALGKPREYLYTWPEHEPTSGEVAKFSALADRRAEGCPVAYLLGRREFWNLELQVNRHVLIPRPDTERLVEVTLESCTGAHLDVVDLGTGSGAIALALASERPGWTLTATDVSQAALDCARCNREKLALDNVSLVESSWCEQLTDKAFDVVVSNPPYIDPEDEHLKQGDLLFEPPGALIADREGLADIMKIVDQSQRILRPGGKIFLEHGFEQADAVRTVLQAGGFSQVQTWQDLNGQDRVTGGQR